MRAIKFFLAGILIALAVGVAAVSGLYLRGHWELEVENISFSPSNRELNNPERGFYYIYGFAISDEETDYRKLVQKKFSEDEDTKLALLQINLQQYRDREISDAGMENLKKLFAELEKTGKDFLVRFLYDWDGKNAENEPENIEIILEHMAQLEPLFRQYEERIYVVQGLFIGNWGEMNGTRYTNQEDMQKLTEKLLSVTSEQTYLSVRRPVHWRQITDIKNPEIEMTSEAARMGLYNDGMLGSITDVGTYDNSNVDKNIYRAWNREEELKFQNILCRYVPNGGEVIRKNIYNEFSAAVETFKEMHVSYLNQDYDKDVLNAWEETIIESGQFAGMDGLTYISRHLGYRFLIYNSNISYDLKEDSIDVNVQIKNEGFAPIYREQDVILEIYDEEGNLVCQEIFEEDIRTLYGGTDSEKIMNFHKRIPVFGWDAEHYQVYFSVRNSLNGEMLELANQEEMTDLGYKIAEIKGGIQR